MEAKLEVLTASSKVAGGFLVFGLSPAEYAGICTALYFFVQTLYIIWKWNKERKLDVSGK
ncbi:hypothetical protein [Dyadobacter jiangsuensis]|nr:hypothetical protein [Dyadobacter jiangsuensis]